MPGSLAPRPRPAPPRRSTRLPAAQRLPLLLALVVAVAVTGCGTSTSPGPTAPDTSSPTPATPSGAPDASATPLPPGAFAFDLPDGWRAVRLDGSYDKLIAEVAAINPTVAESLQARLTNVPASGSYFAFDASRATIAAGDVVTLSVTETDLPPDVSLATFAAALHDQVEKLVEDKVELRQILVTAGQASSLAYLAPLTRPDGKEGTVAVTQVLYVLPGRGYVITFSTPPARANDYAKTVAEIATSFRIVF